MGHAELIAKDDILLIKEIDNIFVAELCPNITEDTVNRFTRFLFYFS